MTRLLWFRRFAMAYGMAFAVLYVAALFGNLALITVYPSLGIVLLGTHRPKDAVDPALGFVVPPMYWYGWLASAALGAVAVGVIATFLPARWTQAFGSSWVWAIAAGSMAACVYLTLPWFGL